MAYATNDGVRIRWESFGDAGREPVLLIMGLGYTLEMWHRVIPALSETHRVIAFDNRGVGGSDVPPPPYRYPDMARDAVAVLDAAGAERAHVYGVSMGGAIAQQLALDAPSRAASIVLASTYCGGAPFVPVGPEVYELLARRAQMEPEEGIRVMLPYVYDPSTPSALIEEDLAIRLAHYPRAEGYLGQVLAAEGWDVSEAIRELDVPTLVIHGESDGLVHPENGRVLAERIPGARLVTLPGASHVFFTEAAGAANAAVLGFLREHAMVRT